MCKWRLAVYAALVLAVPPLHLQVAAQAKLACCFCPAVLQQPHPSVALLRPQVAAQGGGHGSGCVCAVVRATSLLPLLPLHPGHLRHAGCAALR